MGPQGLCKHRPDIEADKDIIGTNTLRGARDELGLGGFERNIRPYAH